MIFLAKNLTYLLSVLKNIKQKDLAKETGLTTSTLSSYKSENKRKRTYPTPETLRILCDKLGVDANTMLYVDIEASGSIPLAIEQGLQLFGVKLADFPDYEVYLNKNITYLLSLRGMNTFEMCKELDINEGYVNNLSNNDEISGLFPISEFLEVSLHSLIAVDLRKAGFSLLQSKSSPKLSKSAKRLLDKRKGIVDDSPIVVSKAEPEQGLAGLRRENELLKQLLEDNKARLRDKDKIIELLNNK